MPKKKWAVASAALAVVKGKKLSTNSNKAKSKKNNQYCDSSEESSDTYSSGKEQSLSVGTISYSKQSSVHGSDISLKSQLDEDEISDSSSSYGCGTYHRRESLSRSSLSYYSEDEESYFSSESSRQLSDLSESTSAALPPELENCPSSSLVESRLSDCDVSTDNNLLRLGIEVSKALEEEIDEGNLIVDFSPSIEDDQIGHVKGRICGNTKCINGPSDKIEILDQEVDVKVSDLLKNVKRQKMLAFDANFLERRQIRSQSPPTAKSKVLSSCLRETQIGCFADSKDTTRQQKKISTTSVRDVGGELSYSLKTELLANANSNLRSSVTSVASEESIDSQNDDASKKSVGSSRFASMMANLKSSNEAHYNVESKRKDSSTTEDNTGSDDEHIFEAPKIVNERGQSMRSISQEMPEISLHFDDFLGGSKSEADEEEEGKRSRFRVRRPSLHQGNDNSSEIIMTNQKGAISDAPQVEGFDNDNSDDESRHSDASFSSVSSGEDQNAKPVTNIARIRDPDDDENSSDDDLEYYNEPTMTILTPITEMGSMESDVETTSHVSDESGSDCDDIALSQTKDSRLGKHENPNIFQVIKQVRANSPNLRQIKLNDSGLNDFDAAKLLYLLHKNSYVTHISLANNKLGDGSAISLAQILIRSKTILFICLRGNNIGNKGALALKKVLRLNDTLSHLDVNDNDIDSYVMEGMQKKSSVIVPSHLLPVCALNNSIAQGNGSNVHLPFVNSEVAPRLDLDSLEVGRSGSGKEKIKICRLINIFDETCSYGVKNHALFQSKISIAEDPGLKPGYHNEVAFHLAMSLSLFHLDSKWHLKGSSMAEGNSETCLSCLGNNRILPWDKGEDEHKASRPLPDTTKLRWQQSASKPPTLRKNLFSLNKKCIKKKLSCGSRPLYCPPALTEPHQSLGEKIRQWMSSLKRLDPRWQIRSFFNDVTLTYRSGKSALVLFYLVIVCVEYEVLVF